MVRSAVRLWPIFCTVVLISLWGAPAVSQQFRRPFPADELRTNLAEAQQAAAAGEFAEAVDRWQAVLDMPEDYFDPARPDSSLRSGAEEQLRILPAEGRQEYEVRFGPQARALLTDALRDHDRQRLNEVVRRYFLTEAGQAAAIVLAQGLADEGQPLSAARLYDRLALHPRTSAQHREDWLLRSQVCWRLAGFAGLAAERQAAGQLPATAPTAGPSPPSIELSAAQLAQLPPLADSGPALLDSTMFRGNPQRDAAYFPAVAVGPVVWKAAVVDRTDSEDRFEDPESPRTAEVSGRMRSQVERPTTANDDRVLLPAGAPITIDGLAVFRGPASVKAVSLATGQLAWSCIFVDDTFHHLLDQEWTRRDEDWYGANLDLLLAQRMWRDASAATLSTDGQNVYAVFDAGMISSIMQSAVALPALSEHPLAPHAYNRLLAIELHTGRIRWELGGPPAGAALSGAYFLGAPLPLDGQLYCLVEDQGQVQLVVLEPGARGVTVAWSQALYNPTANLSNPAVGIERRLAGLTPSVSGDVVICPTGETTIVAVDRRRRALLWAHEYRRPSYDAPQQALAIRMLMNQQQSRGRIEDQLMDQLLQSDHWQDAAAVIAGEYVLCTPPDSQELLCLGLLDGKPVWRQPRGERQFIATVDQSRVVIVGQEQVEALQLESGAPAWNGVLPIPPPAGRGFRHGRLYALPLATGEVATMDLETGRLVARTPLPPESGRGNLLSADGRIVCQTADSVFGMQPLDQLTRDVESQLAAQPNDAAALMRRGEIHVHLGEEAPGLDDLRRAIVADPKSPAGRLLATILIEGLRTNFDAYRGRAAEIEQLVTAPADQTLFHRLYAAGLQRRGEVAAALQQYLKYADTVSDDGGLLRVDGARQVRSPQWIAGRLDELLESAGTEERGRLQSELAKKVEDALANDSTQRLAVLRQVIPEPRERRRIDQQLAATAETSELQSELLLLELLKSPDPQESAVATARLAERWLATGRRSDLLHQLLARLGGPLSAQACLNGRTGGELLTAWRADPPRAALIDAPDPWPTTHVNVKEHVRNLPTMTYAVRQLGPRSELLRGWTFVTDPGGTKLMACDEWGRQLWQVPTGRTGVLPGRQGPNYVRYISTYGRLLLLVAADQWTLLDAISLGDAPTVLAAERLVADGDGRQFIPNMPRGGQPIRNRNRPWIDPQSGSVPMGNVGPIAGGMFVYQAGSQLTAIDVATGRPVWTHDRPELTPGGDILADERTVIVWPPDSTDLQMFRAVDGSALGNARLPAHRELPQPEGIWGTGIVTTERGIDGRTLTLGMFDPVQQQQIWRREAVDVADWGVVDGHDFYVLQKDQRLQIIDGDSGAIQAELQLPADGKATQAAVWSDSQRWYVATYRETEERQFPRSSQVTIVNGVVAAAARGSGELVWTVPVQRQLLHRDIPGGWPFLVLGTWSTPPGRTANERTATSTCTALLLEKSSGRILMETTAPGRDSSLGWQSEPAQHTIHLSVGSIKSTIEFGEPPAPKDPPESK